MLLPFMGRQWSWDSPWDVLAMSTYNTITSLAESPLVEGLIYAGTDGFGSATTPLGGHIWVTTNAAGGTSTWADRTGSINPGSFPVSGVTIDTADATGQTAYVSVMGFHVSHIWKTTNAGTTFRPVFDNERVISMGDLAITFEETTSDLRQSRSAGGASFASSGKPRRRGLIGGIVVVVLIGTMFLSDVVNNAAAAVLVAPIAISLANGLNVSADPFLMSVAIGASCAFLTPIGHQSNTLVLVPGGYRFSDYWRVGLPLEVLIVIVGLPVILWWWPLRP